MMVMVVRSDPVRSDLIVDGSAMPAVMGEAGRGEGKGLGRD